VALAEVVAFRDKAGFARIRREDGLRTASVTAEVDERINTSDQIIQAMQQEGLQALARKHGVSVEFRGKAEEQERTLGDMKLGALIAMIAIYMILAAIFSSYVRPFSVMAVGLSGIVVNDSIILVRAIEERLRAGETLVEAVTGGARDRLRAVILTSVTTMFGLLPLLFETSLQAQFLKPMAVTIVFGLLGSTFIVLVLVPILLVVQADITAIFARLKLFFTGQQETSGL
jgi:multidrug efflux pump subunit AcrB